MPQSRHRHRHRASSLCVRPAPGPCASPGVCASAQLIEAPAGGGVVDLAAGGAYGAQALACPSRDRAGIADFEFARPGPHTLQLAARRTESPYRPTPQSPSGSRPTRPQVRAADVRTRRVRTRMHPHTRACAGCTVRSSQSEAARVDGTRSTWEVSAVADGACAPPT
jgi:hypothetical protein